MQPVRIVKAFDVIGDGVFSRPPGRPRLTVDELGFERREEALGDGIIPAVALATHRTDDAMIAQHSLIRHGGILAAPVGRCTRPGAGTRRPRAICSASRASSVRRWRLHRPPDDPARAQVEDDRQRAHAGSHRCPGWRHGSPGCVPSAGRCPAAAGSAAGGLRRGSRSDSPAARDTGTARRGWLSPHAHTRTSCVFLGEEGRRLF